MTPEELNEALTELVERTKRLLAELARAEAEAAAEAGTRDGPTEPPPQPRKAA